MINNIAGVSIYAELLSDKESTDIILLIYYVSGVYFSRADKAVTATSSYDSLTF